MRKRSILILALLVVIGGVGVITISGALGLTNGITQPKWEYMYAAKFVCGLMKPTPNLKGEPPVKPANYATDINIHNPQEWWVEKDGAFVPVSVRMSKKVVEAIGEPEQGRPLGEHPFELLPDGATSADCNEIYKLLGVNPATKPLKIGFFVIKSEAPLDVVGVYTAATGPGLATAGTIAVPNLLWSISEDIEHVPASNLVPLPENAAPPAN